MTLKSGVLRTLTPNYDTISVLRRSVRLHAAHAIGELKNCMHFGTCPKCMNSKTAVSAETTETEQMVGQNTFVHWIIGNF